MKLAVSESFKEADLHCCSSRSNGFSSCTTKSFRADGDILLRAPIELVKERAHEPRCRTDARFRVSTELNRGGNARACALPVRIFFLPE